MTACKQAAQSGYLNAMAAATYLVHKGVPFRTAHEKIGNAVRFALEKGVELERSHARRTARNSAPSSSEDFFSAITLEATLDCHDVIGGTARASRARRLWPQLLSASHSCDAERRGGRPCWCVRPCFRMPRTSTTW